MWASITTIHQPTTLSQAVGLYHYPEQVFLAGGSYLVAERNPNITGLISIQPLLGKRIQTTQHSITIEAGATVQDIIEQLPHSPLATIACDSCFSKNIRNQRTVGGEIAMQRLDSDLVAALYAINGNLAMFTGNEQTTTLRDWPGSGIITKLQLDALRVAQLRIFRYTILPSAAPFLILAVVPHHTGIDCVIAGKVKKLGFYQLKQSQLAAEPCKKLSQELAGTYFQDDQHGSIAYKAHLLEVSFQQLVQ